MTHAELIAALGAATGPSMAINREVAKYAGWFRVAPRFHKGGGWIAPEDFLGADDEGRPKLDSLHGTDIHREPPNFTASIDEALTLMPDNYDCLVCCINGKWQATCGPKNSFQDVGDQKGATPAIALCIAALKARKETT